MAFFEGVNDFKDNVKVRDSVRIILEDKNIGSYTGAVFFVSGSWEKPSWLEGLVEKGQLNPDETDVVLSSFTLHTRFDRINENQIKQLGLVGLSLDNKTISGMRIRGYETSRSSPYEGW
ncbi:hypothetical protein ACFLZB_02750 [Nanoarchaeota archaeon]